MGATSVTGVYTKSKIKPEFDYKHLVAADFLEEHGFIETATFLREEAKSDRYAQPFAKKDGN